MANRDLVITFLNGDTLNVHRDADTQVGQICAELEQVLKVHDLMEIKLIIGSTVLGDPLPDILDGTIQGVISPSPTKALTAVQTYTDTIHRTPEAAGSDNAPSAPSEDDSISCASFASESSSDYGYMALIHPFTKTNKEDHMSTPSLPLSPEAMSCRKALTIIENDFEALSDSQEVTHTLLDLSELQGYKLDKLPISLELSIKGIQILQSNIVRPGLAEQVKEYMHNGLYDVVRLACHSTRKDAGTWLSAIVELMAAAHCSTPASRFSLCKIISSCPAAGARLAATRALAELAFAKHERDIANIAERDINEEVRRTAQAIHKEGMKNFTDADDDPF